MIGFVVYGVGQVFLVIIFSLLQKIHFVEGRTDISIINSEPAYRYRIQPPNSNSMCTLYILLISTAEIDRSLWEKVIDDNKETSLLCLITSSYKDVPDPSVSFLEQCTVNIIVTTESPNYYIARSPHSSRLPPHNAFIVITSDCTYYYFGKDGWRRPTLFYSFPSYCKWSNDASFLSLYINFFDSTSQKAKMVLLSGNTEINLFETIVLSNLDEYKHLMYVVGGKKSWANNPQKLLFCCERLLVNTDCWCESYLMQLSTLGRKFNVSLTFNEEYFQQYSAGWVFLNHAMVTLTKSTSFSFAKGLTISDDLSIRYVYCLQNDKFFLITFFALVSPFTPTVWVFVLVTICVLFLLHTISFRRMRPSENIIYLLRLILEQDVFLSGLPAVVICLSIYVLHVIFRMRMTSNLLIPAETKPVASLDVLVSQGFKYTYDDTVGSWLYTILELNQIHTKNLDLREFSVTWLTFNRYENIKSLETKFIHITLFPLSKVEQNLRIVSSLSQNKTCFVGNKTLWSCRKGFLFLHPWEIKFASFIQTLNENGLNSLFLSYTDYFDKLTYHKHNTQIKTHLLMNPKVNEDQNNFIHMKEAYPMFIVLLLLLVISSVIFITYEIPRPFRDGMTVSNLLFVLSRISLIMSNRIQRNLIPQTE